MFPATPSPQSLDISGASALSGPGPFSKFLRQLRGRKRDNLPESSVHLK